MIYFVAKGTPDACGPGCSEWIAAEGKIDPEAGQRLRDFLGALPRRDLPIFFNSAGGIVGPAIEISSILREHRMTVGVGRTLPEGCRQATANDDACRRVMQSKREHKARLVTGGARCLSACAYAFVGGSVRQVARDAQLGVHAFRWLPGTFPQGSGVSVDDVHALLKRYMIEMGVDPAVIDAGAKVGADRIRYLTRDEIARFGVETRGYYETPWMPYENRSSQFVVLKSVTATREADGKAYRTGNARIWCVGGGASIRFVYQREPSADETGVPAVIRIAAGDREYMLRASARRRQTTPTSAEIITGFEVEGGETKPGTEQWRAMVSWDFLRNAMAAPGIIITETFPPQGNGSGWSRTVKFSTSGLSKALHRVEKSCGEPNFIDVPGVKFIDMPGAPGGR